MKNPTITKEDVYELKNKKKQVLNLVMTLKCDFRISRNAEIAQQEMRKSHTNDTDLSNTGYIDTENHDMNDLNDIELKK
ncbi:replication initiator protein [Staphylococcus aureus subsp. aureus D139]|uniref:hypothetical protein n=1 Tax=Staphylococcus aureus TaxID=1280 RepID=UPI0001C0BE65|nr:hypothetical protein [Staphylococcus aureus]EFB48344.1 replication initiator protein [Staphylococcus aureus subsp. aureus D139]MCB8117383.1 replication initiation protein [Staphylococcus aureus]HBU9608927.1 replication initiation protein [Staphylococcus aureus]HCG2331669.1 replication initiation protein [Staphylococcus aureus]HDI6818787.1 replication initiation protein [Staphylococcus aureus]